MTAKERSLYASMTAEDAFGIRRYQSALAALSIRQATEAG